MNAMPTPVQAATSLDEYLQGRAWYSGVSLSGIGADAVICLEADDLQAAAKLVESLGKHWHGYPVLVRRAAS